MYERQLMQHAAPQINQSINQLDDFLFPHSPGAAVLQSRSVWQVEEAAARMAGEEVTPEELTPK